MFVLLLGFSSDKRPRYREVTFARVVSAAVMRVYGLASLDRWSEGQYLNDVFTGRLEAERGPVNQGSSF